MSPRSHGPTLITVGFYNRRILPWVIDRVMSGSVHESVRPGVLASAIEPVLEIGFGTGLNLRHYPPHIREIAIIEPNPGMTDRAQRRIDAASITVRPFHLIDGVRFPFADASFNTVVSTWTLCSIADIHGALAEVLRVLTPGGRLLFVEHGLSPQPGVARIQRLFTPINKRLGGGCHLDRNIPALLRAHPFQLENLTEQYLPGLPRAGGYTFRGAARKA